MSDTPQETAEKPTERDESGKFLPGNRGSRGRPKGSLGFAKRMRKLLFSADPATGVTPEDVALSILRDPKSMHWFSTYKFVAERAYGKAAQYLEVTGADGGPVEVKGSLGDGGDSERIARILATLARADALPTELRLGSAGALPDATDNPVHETGADAPTGGIPPVERP